MSKFITALGLIGLLEAVNNQNEAKFNEFSKIEDKSDSFIVACHDNATEDVKVFPVFPGNVNENSILLYSKEYLDKVEGKAVKYFSEEDKHISIAVVSKKAVVKAEKPKEPDNTDDKKKLAEVPKK